MTNKLYDILKKIYVEVPEVPNKVIGLSNDMMAEAHQAIEALIDGLVPEKKGTDAYVGTAEHPILINGAFENGYDKAIDDMKDNIAGLKGQHGD